MKTLIIGGGWIGKICSEAWSDSELCTRKIKSVEGALDVIDSYQPDVVLNAAGVTGKPNVDWCETHVAETVEGNVLLPYFLAEACKRKNVYMLHIGSGCVFYGESLHSDGQWKPDDFANPQAVYSRAKYAADLILENYDNVGIARIRMPIDSIPGPRNIIDKLVAYEQVIDVENSVTVIDDMVKVLREILDKKIPDIFHVVNKGVVKHREIIDLYRKYVDPTLEKNWIDEDQLVGLGLATKKRSNNFLSSDNLVKYGINIPDIHESMDKLMQQYSKNIKK
jgi:dTDP-4-dehydrorhamnose reductase